MFEGPDYDHATTNWGDGFGVEYNQWDKHSITACKCDKGYSGPDCTQLLCPRGDDPLTINQNYRKMKFTLTNPSEYATGSVGFQFQGQTVLLSLDDLAACSATISNNGPFGIVGCETNQWTVAYVFYHEFTLTFYSWPVYPTGNNLYEHNGNPAKEDFHCDMTYVVTITNPDSAYCVFEDKVSEDIMEYALCSNRGHCDSKTGICSCVDGYGGPACSNATYLYYTDHTNTPAMEVTAPGLEFSSSVLQLSAARERSPDFYFIEANAGGNSGTVFSVRGDGLVTIDHLRALKGGVTIESGGLVVTSGGTTIASGGLNVNTKGTTSPVASLHSDYQGTLTSAYTALHIDTNAATSVHYLLRAYNQGNAMFNVGAGGLVEVTTGGMQVTGGVTIESGGLSITGGATIRDGGLVVTRHGIAVTGGMTVQNEGLRVQEGGFEVFGGGFSIYSGGVVLEDGGMSIRSTGLSVTGGVTINHGGMQLTGGLTVNSNGINVDGSQGIAVKNGGVVVETKGVTISSGGLRITTHGLTVAEGGMAIDNGRLFVQNDGIYVTGGATIHDGMIISQGMTVKDSGLRVVGGMTVSHAGLHVTGGASIASLGAHVYGGITVEGGAINAGNGVDVTGYVTVRNGGLRIDSGGLVVSGGMTVFGNTALQTSATVFSDRRLKSNLAPIKNALGKVSQLQGVYFTWIQDEEAGMTFDEDSHVGVIAQEVMSVLPEAVESGKEGSKYLGVDYSQIIPLLIEAIHDLEEIVTEDLAEQDTCVRALHQLQRRVMTDRRPEKASGQVPMQAETQSESQILQSTTKPSRDSDSASASNGVVGCAGAEEELSVMTTEVQLMRETNLQLQREMESLRRDIDELSKLSASSTSTSGSASASASGVVSEGRVLSAGVLSWTVENGSGDIQGANAGVKNIVQVESELEANVGRIEGVEEVKSVPKLREKILHHVQRILHEAKMFTPFRRFFSTQMNRIAYNV